MWRCRMAPGVAGWCHLALPDGPWRCRITGRCRPAWAVPAVRWHRPAASPHVTWRCRVVLALPVGAVPARRPLKFSNRGSVRSAQNLHTCCCKYGCDQSHFATFATFRLWSLTESVRDANFGSRHNHKLGVGEANLFSFRAGRFMRSCIPCASFPTSPFSMVIANVPRGSFGPRG